MFLMKLSLPELRLKCGEDEDSLWEELSLKCEPFLSGRFRDPLCSRVGVGGGSFLASAPFPVTKTAMVTEQENEFQEKFQRT